MGQGVVGYDTDLIYTTAESRAHMPNAVYGPYATKVRPRMDFTEGDMRTWYEKYNPQKRFNLDEKNIKQPIFTFAKLEKTSVIFNLSNNTFDAKSVQKTKWN